MNPNIAKLVRRWPPSWRRQFQEIKEKAQKAGSAAGEVAQLRAQNAQLSNAVASLNAEVSDLKRKG